MAAFATGLLIGCNEQEEAIQRRKERYRQELLQQIEEQQRNKRKEKELELKVAVTGAIDPEKEHQQKQPHRIQQFGVVKREHLGRKQDTPYRPGMVPGDRIAQEYEREPPEIPRVAFQSPILDYSTAMGHPAGARLWGTGDPPMREDLHKGISGTLGEMVAPRVTSNPPPPAPALSEAYSTPYDEAYYYYGARNPLDPNLTYLPLVQNLPAGTPASMLQPPAGPHEQSTLQHDPSPSLGSFPSQRSQHPRENVLGYKDALRQQIQERQERRRQEHEERERYEAKLEAEMKAYEPWGRGGAGAPLRDQRGNLISDLKRMHRSNEEAYKNPKSHSDRTIVVPTDQNSNTPRAENKESSRVSGLISSFTRPSPHARGNVFTEQPTPQQLHKQEKYKLSLKQQIEEKQKFEAERREKLRLEEEREEKRLAEERLHIQRQYEEEQEKEKRKEMEQNNKNQEIIRQHEERHKEDEKKKKSEELKEKLKQQYEQERRAQLEQPFRSESPPIPTIQKRLDSHNPRRPMSVESRRSASRLSDTEHLNSVRSDSGNKTVQTRSVCTPRSPPVPARRNQIRAAEEQQGVISELSVLRRRLRSEQRRLDGQLDQTDREETPLKTRERPVLDVFDMARLRMQVPARRPPSNTRVTNIHNMQDFNQLKYRDSESREEVRRVYPGPPTDEDSLEIQQQALLKEQQRRLNNMRRVKTDDYFDLASPMKPAYYQWMKDQAEDAERHSLLQSESAFIDPSGYSFPPETPAVRSSARERRRRARRPHAEETADRTEIREFVASVNTFHLDREHKKHDMNRWRSEETSADEDESPSPLASRRVSTTTFSTEPWLRPGTTDTVKELMAGRRPPSTGPVNTSLFM